eukprot:TRINITY_DN82883_c0_g1_i1.p1 TRINITY_DN82883_c0_g1~~TRINITY_DN82883_c0_g1_i1.p1  ORF type:complete len:322 (-),score=76.81 TRINITY_DN82883_c0_g1_i1:247-1212(-)
MAAAKGKTLFVGNIPYDATEEELKKTFSVVGPVQNFRLVFDKETQQPKGFGFVDFIDADTAVKCIKQHSDIEYDGRRLRVDLADIAIRKGDGKGPPGGGMLALGDIGGASSNVSSSSRPPPVIPSLPPPSMAALRNPGGTGPKAIDSSGGNALAADLEKARALLADVASVHTEIAQAVAALPMSQLQICLGALQRLAQEAPEEARCMLQDHPSLCYGLLHAQLLLGLSGELKMPPSSDEMGQLKDQLVARRTASRPGALAARTGRPPQPPPGRPPMMAGGVLQPPPPPPMKAASASPGTGITSKAPAVASPAGPAAKRART